MINCILMCNFTCAKLQQRFFFMYWIVYMQRGQTFTRISTVF